MIEKPKIRLVAPPSQIIRANGSAILKRGCAELRFDGDQSIELLQRLLQTFRSGATEEEVFDHLTPDEKPLARQLIALLQSRNFLMPVKTTAMDKPDNDKEDALDILYWHFDPVSRRTSDRLRCRRIVILGVNTISRRMLEALQASDFEHVTLIDHPGLKNDQKNEVFRTLDYDTWVKDLDWPALDCLIATSDFGGRELMREWNSLAVRHRCHFLPVVLQDVIGYVGPFVIPGETACYECLVARENSHLDDPTVRRAVERAAPSGRDVVAFHPLMASVTAEIAAFEVIKFYSEVIPIRHVGTLIEVNLMAARMTPRKVLKIPRCGACSPLHDQSSTSSYKDILASES